MSGCGGAAGGRRKGDCRLTRRGAPCASIIISGGSFGCRRPHTREGGVKWRPPENNQARYPRIVLVKATCEPSPERTGEVTTVPPVPVVYPILVGRVDVDGTAGAHKISKRSDGGLRRRPRQARGVHDEVGRWHQFPANSAQVAVVASNEYFAGYIPAPTVAPAPMSILQSLHASDLHS